jgi:hypothetical protein
VEENQGVTSGILNANPVVFCYQPSPGEIDFVCDERGEAEFVLFSEPKGAVMARHKLSRLFFCEIA